MSKSRKKVLLNTVTVALGCGSCRKPKLSEIYQPHPKPKSSNTYQKHKNYYNCSSSSSWDKDDTATTFNATDTTTTFSPYTETSGIVNGFGRIGCESVAVEKDSDDPYLDFRHSMLQMILENQIYCKDDLRDLLNCFLQLNSPYHHGIIVRAFTEIWNGVFSVKSTNSAKMHFNSKSRDF
ncbi:Transcription repressor OFP6 [Quillaja saponaria]|uniref:Transcription repressor n=1 Tax=Quillaja saponaria TaxID=32244 RepID=A0AAD7VHN9_QUISA|nr:Transcription repressor OFP6 [Quillaja saponaria]